jgi:hypothetical protein
MMKTILVVIFPVLILTGCNEPAPDFGWKITGNSYECKNPDSAERGINEDQISCIWFCKDYRGQKNVDITLIGDTNYKTYTVKTTPSEMCDIR